jgi:hypothetical protein
VYLADFSGIQLVVMIGLQLVMLAYLVVVRPFNTPKTNRLEIFN